jgi:hypothetical protein
LLSIVGTLLIGLAPAFRASGADIMSDLRPTPGHSSVSRVLGREVLVSACALYRDPSSFIGAARNAVLQADNELPLYDVTPLEEIVGNTLAARSDYGLWRRLAWCARARRDGNLWSDVLLRCAPKRRVWNSHGARRAICGRNAARYH